MNANAAAGFGILMPEDQAKLAELLPAFWQPSWQMRFWHQNLQRGNSAGIELGSALQQLPRASGGTQLASLQPEAELSCFQQRMQKRKAASIEADF